MADDIKVSVIVPVYDVEKYLRQCLDSILAQTLSDIEIILINDGSCDGCPQICDEYAKKDKRIRLVHKKNGGYGQSCNVGLNMAQGEYVAICEPDDFLAPQMYADLYKIAKDYNSDIVKSCFNNFFDVDGQTEISKTIWDTANIPQNTFTIFECPLFFYYHPSIWSCIYKREFLEKHHIRFVEASGAGWTDNPFQVQTMCLAKRINYTDEAYYFWRRTTRNEAEDLKDFRLPFRRSDEIHQWLADNNINDFGVLSCLALREMCYVNIALGSAKMEDYNELEPLVAKLLKRITPEHLQSGPVKNESLTADYFRFFAGIKDEFLQIKSGVLEIHPIPGEQPWLAQMQ